MERAFGYARKLSAPGVKIGGPTITVYDAGTVVLSTIYDDNVAVPTPKANPFLGDASGYWFFYAADGRYDVRISGGVPPVDAPYTLGDISLGIGDAKVPSYATAGLPAPAAGQIGRLARVTDGIGGLHMDNGSAWVQVAEGTIDLYERGCDPTGATDDTAKIQAALTSGLGRRIHVPMGVFKATSTLTFKNRCQVFGEGLESNIRFTPAAVDDGLFAADPAGVDNCIFRDFSINGTGPFNRRRGFELTASAGRIMWDNVFFSGLDYRCISHDSATYDVVRNCRFMNCVSPDVADLAAAICFPTYANRIIIEGCRFALNDYSIRIPTVGAAVMINGNSFEADGLTSLPANLNSPIRLTNVRGVSILNNYFEAEQTGAGYGVIYVEGGGGIDISGNYFNGDNSGVVVSDILVFIEATTRGIRVAHNYMVDVLTAFIRGGNYTAHCPGNRYVDGGVELTDYATIMALMVNPETIEIDQPMVFAYNPGNLGDGAGETHAEAMLGAALGDVIAVTAPYDLQGVLATAYVSAANTIAVRLQNESGAPVDLAADNWKAFRRCGSY